MAVAETLARWRSVLLGLTGAVCLLYALMALALGRPDPFAWWIPGGLGVLAAILISARFVWAGASAARAATDELHREVNHRALRHAYWVSLALFVGVSVLVKTGLTTLDTGWAVFGTSMGASYLLLFVFYDWRMGG